MKRRRILLVMFSPAVALCAIAGIFLADLYRRSWNWKVAPVGL
jgi:hypothetical protein